MEVLEAEAAAAGQTVEAYMRATGQYPMEDPEASKVAAQKVALGERKM